MSQTHELTGTIKIINDAQSFPSGFTKRAFVVTTNDDKYPQDIALEFVKDACSKLDSLSVGNEVKVTFNIRGNEYNGKYYVQLAAWKIEKLSDGNAELGVISTDHPQHRSGNQNNCPPPSTTATADALDEDDDIPF